MKTTKMHKTKAIKSNSLKPPLGLEVDSSQAELQLLAWACSSSMASTQEVNSNIGGGEESWENKNWRKRFIKEKKKIAKEASSGTHFNLKELKLLQLEFGSFKPNTYSSPSWLGSNPTQIRIKLFNS